MRRIALVAAALLAVWLLACTAPPTGRQVTAPRPSPTETPEVTPTPGIPRDEAIRGPLLVYRSQWAHGRGWTTLAVPLDGATLREIAGVEPIDLGENAIVTVSPDGRLVAGFGARDDALRVYETETWSETARVELGELAEHRQSLEFFWASERLFAWIVHCPAYGTGGLCAADWVVQLWSVGPASDEAALAADLDLWLLDGRIADHTHVTADGDRLVLLAPREEGDPSVLVLDLATGEVAAEVPVPGLKFGRTAVREVESEEVTGPGGFRAFRPGFTVYEHHYPAAALAEDGTTLHIVHAEVDRVTVVDLDTGRVSRVADYGDTEVDEIDDLLEIAASAGHARSAVLASGGRYLLIDDSARSFGFGPSFVGPWSRAPVGLRILDLDTMSIVFEDEAMAAAATTPGGLLAYGPFVREIDDPRGAWRWIEGLALIDLETFEVTGDYFEGLQVAVEGLSPDGRYAYVSTQGAGWGGGSGCNRDCALVHVLDLDTGEVVAERMLHGRERLLELPGR